AAALPAEASAANPVDLLGSATAATYEAAVGPVLADPNVDALVAIFVPPVVAGADAVAAAIRRAVEAHEPTKPVIAGVGSAAGSPASLADPGSPVVGLPYPESAARALALALERACWLGRPEGTVPSLAGIDVAAARAAIAGAADGQWLDPAAARALLGAYG